MIGPSASLYLPPEWLVVKTSQPYVEAPDGRTGRQPRSLGLEPDISNPVGTLACTYSAQRVLAGLHRNVARSSAALLNFANVGRKRSCECRARDLLIDVASDASLRWPRR